ncbi:hypothetical protein HAX54_037464 [Datura stramonium]|uniref:Uncharacterized protein n=1 Tax=Datura stramonium TaxID=4076 RepID=A0ABS8SGY0_DATST|nr:hypothetical protein [Datura stramonium]
MKTLCKKEKNLEVLLEATNNEVKKTKLGSSTPRKKFNACYDVDFSNADDLIDFEQKKECLAKLKSSTHFTLEFARRALEKKGEENQKSMEPTGDLAEDHLKTSWSEAKSEPRPRSGARLARCLCKRGASEQLTARKVEAKVEATVQATEVQRRHHPVRPIPSQLRCKNFGTKDY